MIFTDCSKAMLLLWIFFCYLCFTFVFIILKCLFLACRERADILTLLCVIFPCVFVTFPYGVSGKVWYLIVSIPDRCLLFYFHWSILYEEHSKKRGIEIEDIYFLRWMPNIFHRVCLKQQNFQECAVQVKILIVSTHQMKYIWYLQKSNFSVYSILFIGYMQCLTHWKRRC